MSNVGLYFLSIVICTISVYFYYKSNKPRMIILPYFIIVLISLILTITYYISDYFTGNGIDESTVFLLRYGLHGAGFSEYLWLIIITLLTLLSIIFFLVWILLIKKNNSKKNYSFLSFFLLFVSIFLNPASADIYKIISFDYSVSNEFFKYYKTPNIIPLDKQKKNFVYIYAESLEYTYFNKKVFPELIKELRKIRSQSTYFTSIFQTPGASTTVSGMTANQLGIPLFTPTYVNSMSGMDQFLSGAVGLGDLLKKEGYYLSYIGGAKLSFAGKGKLYKSHGFSEVLGLEELLPKQKDKNYINGWGLYDDTLFDIVYKRFIELSNKGEKFGLFTLTLDTHSPNGHISKSSKTQIFKDGSNAILNAVASSDYLLSKFINKIINSKYANNTIIVLVSDHLSLKNSAYDKLNTMIKITRHSKKTKIKRTNLFMIIDPSVKTSSKINLFGTTLDIAPTFFPFIGYNLQLGLGRNILMDKKPNISMKKFKRRNKKKVKIATKERMYIFENVNNWRGSITKFWNFPKIHKSISINIKERTINLDSREFKFPILIELNKDLETTLKFAFDITKNMKNTTDFLSTINNNNFFLLIDQGIIIKRINSQVDETSYYLMAGKGTKTLNIIKLDKDLTISTKEIYKLIGKNN